MAEFGKRSRDNFGLALAASLVLHALILSLQFGESGSGLPWFGIPGEARYVTVPTLNAVLRSRVATQQPTQEKAAEPVVSRVDTHATKPLVREPPPPNLPPEPATASMDRLVTIPKDAGEEGRVDGVAADVPKTDAPDMDTAVLSTEEASTWHQPVAKARVEDKVSNEQAVVEKTGETPVLEQKMVEDLARIEEEKAELAAVEREKELVLERKRAEDLARMEAEKAEQAAAAKAREDALAKQAAAEEEAMARKLQAERVAREKAAAEESLAAEKSRMAKSLTGTPEGTRESGTGQVPAKGSELASRALAQARSGMAGLPFGPPADRQRRGSILGRDPRDIQLAFYGEGWRQKVERIGSLNYPKLSRNLRYDPLVVTVSINSDGTLAGVHIEKSSGHPDLDEAVRRIVEMSAPFSAFPPAMKRSYDVVDITRTWNFVEQRPQINNQ